MALKDDRDYEHQNARGMSSSSCSMMESFRNLEAAMAMAKLESLQQSSNNNDRGHGRPGLTRGGGSTKSNNNQSLIEVRLYSCYVPLASLYTRTILYHYTFIHLVHKQSSRDTNYSISLYYMFTITKQNNKTSICAELSQFGYGIATSKTKFINRYEYKGNV